MIRMQVSPGEAMDRLAIYEVKLRKGPIEWQPRLKVDMAALEEAVKLVVCMDNVEHLMEDLVRINEKLWDLENEMEQPEPPAALGKCISVWNRRRSEAKKAVDCFFQVDTELKKYGV